MTGRPSFETLLLSVRDGVATLTLNRPKVANAASPTMMRELLLALDQIEESESGVRCLLLTGAGRAFCAGADLSPGVSGADNVGTRDGGFDLEHFYHPVLRRLRDLKFPLLVAVNGAAVGVAASIALMGDLILCGRSAYFLHAFRAVGLVPDGGATWLLPRLVGRARALEISLLGERLSAETALEWGLVNRVYEDDALMEEAHTLAHGVAGGPTLALGLTRQLYWASAGNSYEEQLHAERLSQRCAAASDDFDEGIAAFRQKRPPRFEGR